MSLYRDKAVVLRTYKLGEADRIVVFMTEHHGKVRAVAKGVRKTKSKFGSRLQPLSHVDLLLYEGRDLDIVNQVDLVTTQVALHADLDQMTRGMAMLEAVEQLALDREPTPHLFKMLVGGLRTLGETNSELVVGAFYWKLLAAEGMRPELDACVSCQTPIGVLTDDIYFFNIDSGGLQCRQCRLGHRISVEAVLLMRQILGGELIDALNQPTGAATHEVMQLATMAMEHHIERRLKAIATLYDNVGL